MVGEALLTCTKCKEEKPTCQFFRSKNLTRGFSYYCKPCHKTFRSDRKEYYQQRFQDEKSKYQQWKRTWQHNNQKVNREQHRRRELRKKGLKTESISYLIVYERDRGICQLCWQPITFKEMTLDHIIPLAKGGSHSYDNVQTAHHSCNSKKGVQCSL